MFKFCPACASEKIDFADGKVFRCPDCGLVYYHNTAAATGCIISVPENAVGKAADTFAAERSVERIIFLVRGKDPAKGKLDLPGGFADPGEGIFECLYRELQEEIGWSPLIPQGASLADVFTLFASFSNVYPYKNIAYNTCDLYFCLSAPGLREQDLRLEQAEIAAVRFLKPEDIDYREIAFDSTRRAVQTYLAKAGRQNSA
ncbi:MAG: NUDIX domain-containing protein [Treponema sp.]|jgi:ADP-ribose pyrophosphatase YjhB (NUDIX family)|nr:NUDIX domain-containing protein [Treponema sp.]